jgi:hypothetical protein
MKRMSPTANPPHTDSTRLPGWLIPPFLAGATLALAGGFWDDAWHTERGRDSFFLAPHLAIYGGISLAGAALGLWALLAVRERGARAVRKDRALGLALLSMAVTLASAPVDNLWHVVFGRDAVIWSPPHVLGIVGTAGLAVAILVELTQSSATWGRALRWVAGALLLAALSFLVVEYDTDVPQFPVIWYLPVLALGSSFALALVRLATREPWAATRTATLHLAYFALVAGFLAVQGFDTPKAPLVLGAAITLDLAAGRRWPLAAQAALFAAALYPLYVPALDLLGHGVRLGTADVALGLPLSVLVVFMVFAVIAGRRPRIGAGRRVAVASLCTLVLGLAIAPSALAHDPGQGAPAGAFDFDARLKAETLRVVARRDGDDCLRLVPEQLVARRAGAVEHGALRRAGCLFAGTIRLPAEGRWFVYLDARKRGQTVESWIPVKVDEGESPFRSADRFAYIADRKPATVLKWAIGIVMYGLTLAFVVAMVILVGRAARRPRAARFGPSS